MALPALPRDFWQRPPHLRIVKVPGHPFVVFPYVDHSALADVTHSTDDGSRCPDCRRLGGHCQRHRVARA